MIKSLLLKNFQIHRKLLVEFDPHITIITGDNDRGKTAVIRALRWLCLNKPSGEEFRRWESNGTSVKLNLDKHSIIRRRGRKNSYSLDGHKFFAFGANVPDPVSNILNVIPECFQLQHDPAFWMTESPSQVARNLNKVINLEIIDASLSSINHEHRRAKLSVEVCGERLRGARERKRELGWIPNLLSDLEKLEQKQTAIEEVRQKQTTLQNLIKEVQSTQRTIKSVEGPLNLGRQLVVRGQAIQDKRKQLKSLEIRIEEIESWSRTIKKKEAELNQVMEKIKEVKSCPVCQGPL